MVSLLSPRPATSTHSLGQLPSATYMEKSGTKLRTAVKSSPSQMVSSLSPSPATAARSLGQPPSATYSERLGSSWWKVVKLGLSGTYQELSQLREISIRLFRHLMKTVLWNNKRRMKTNV